MHFILLRKVSKFLKIRSVSAFESTVQRDGQRKSSPIYKEKKMNKNKTVSLTFKVARDRGGGEK